MKHRYRWDADKQEVVEVTGEAPAAAPDSTNFAVPNYEFRAWSLPGRPRVKNRREIEDKVARSKDSDGGGHWVWDR